MWLSNMYISNVKEAINVPFTFESARGRTNEKALLDSGATENFMDSETVRRLRIGTRELPHPRRVFNVDGTENRAGTITRSCQLKVSRGEKSELQTFYITSLGGDRVIFGYPWLRAFKPQVDWGGGRVKGPQTVVKTSILDLARSKAQNIKDWGKKAAIRWANTFP